MPPKQLDAAQKAIAARLRERVEAQRIASLKSILSPLRENFAEAAAAEIKTRLMAEDVVANHPDFKAVSVSQVTLLIDQILEETAAAK
jgi:hypothetical protein